MRERPAKSPSTIYNIYIKPTYHGQPARGVPIGRILRKVDV